MRTLDLPQVRLPYVWITLSLALVVALGIGGAQNPGTRASQIEFLVWLNGHGNAFLDFLAQAIELILSPPCAITLTTLTAIVAGVTSRSWLRGVGIGLAVFAAWLPTGVLKVIFEAPRPDESVLPHILVPAQRDSSFPSGHVSFAIGLAYAAYLLFGRSSRRATRWALSIGGVFVVFVGYTRMYVGVHYPTDVTASVFASISGILIFNLLWDAVQQRVVSRRKS